MHYVFWKSYVRNPLVFRPIVMLLLVGKRCYPLAFVWGKTLLSLIKHHLKVLCSQSTGLSTHCYACGETLLSICFCFCGNAAISHQTSSKGLMFKIHRSFAPLLCFYLWGNAAIHLLLSLIKRHLKVLCSQSTGLSPHCYAFACGETLLSLIGNALRFVKVLCSKSASLSPHCYAFACGENMATSRAECLIMTFWFAKVLVWLAARNHILLKCSDCAVSVNCLHVRLMGSLQYLREGDWWCRLFFWFVFGDVLTQGGDRTTLSTVYNWICCHWNEFLDRYHG